MTCGIYMLIWETTDKVYIGQSRVSIENRFTEHLYYLRNKTHSKKLNAAYKEFGLPHSFKVLQECDPSVIDELEEYFIAEYNTVNNGFNTCRESGGYWGLPGELNPMSKYSNEEICEVFDYLVDNPKTNFSDISSIFNIGVGVISGITSGVSHKWLAEKFPDKYAKLMSYKGIRHTGDSCYNSIITNEQALQVLNLLVIPINNFKFISDNTGVSTKIIRGISSGSSHTWLSRECPEKYEKLVSLKGTRQIGEDNPNAKYTIDKYKEVVYLIATSDLPLKDISEKVGVSHSVVMHISSGESHTYLKDVMPKEYEVLMSKKGRKKSYTRSYVYPDLIDSSGTMYKIDNIKQFAEKMGLDSSTLSKVIRGKAKTHKGFRLYTNE